MSENHYLQWGEYQANWKRYLSELSTDNDSADVTLISDDKMKFSAHKIVLSSCSNMFKVILKINTHAHPLLFLGGISSSNLGLILDYMYNGKVNLLKDHLESFLKSAEKLEIKGLNSDIRVRPISDLHHSGQDNNEDIGKAQVNPRRLSHLDSDSDDNALQIDESSDIPEYEMESTEMLEGEQSKQNDEKPIAASTSEMISIDGEIISPKDLDLKIRELYRKINGVWSCLKCEYTYKTASQLRKHVEKHIEGLAINCSICNKPFNQRHSLNVHKKMHLTKN